MGFIREPDGVDFVIAPASYTNEDRAEVSAFFRRQMASKLLENSKDSVTAPQPRRSAFKKVAAML